jgi:hypothetical protein
MNAEVIVFYILCLCYENYGDNILVYLLVNTGRAQTQLGCKFDAFVPLRNAHQNSQQLQLLVMRRVSDARFRRNNGGVPSLTSHRRRGAAYVLLH